MTYENPHFRIFADWHKFLPTEELRALPEAVWMLRSRETRFAPYCKINGQRSTAWYKASSVSEFFQHQYGAVFPDCVARLIKEGGFPEPEQFGAIRRKLESNRGKNDVTVDDIIKAIQALNVKNKADAKADAKAQAKQRKKRSAKSAVRHLVRPVKPKAKP